MKSAMPGTVTATMPCSGSADEAWGDQLGAGRAEAVRPPAEPGGDLAGGAAGVTVGGHRSQVVCPARCQRAQKKPLSRATRPTAVPRRGDSVLLYAARDRYRALREPVSGPLPRPVAVRSSVACSAPAAVRDLLTRQEHPPLGMLDDARAVVSLTKSSHTCQFGSTVSPPKGWGLTWPTLT